MPVEGKCKRQVFPPAAAAVAAVVRADGAPSRQRRCKTRSLPRHDGGGGGGGGCSDVAVQSISSMIEQIRHCESILADGLVAGGGGGGGREPLSKRLLDKVQRLRGLASAVSGDDPRGPPSRRRRHRTRGGRAISLLATVDRNNNKCCCNAASSSNADHARQEPLEEVSSLSANVHPGTMVDDGEEGDIYDDYGKPAKQQPTAPKVYPKHQDYCLCHKRKCQRCGCICPCTEHACPSCGYTSRVLMTMRAVEGLKDIAEAQRSRFRNGQLTSSQAMPRCKQKRKKFLLNEANSECNHAVMVRVGGGFVPLVEYLKSHNKVVLSKFTRGDGSAFLSPWRPYYPGPLKKGKPRGIRYVDSVTQQLEEIIFANREAGKSHCICP